MSDERKSLVKGTVVAAATAATPDFDLDCATLRDHYRFIINGGMDADAGVVMAVGGGGEGYFLDDKEWSDAVKIFAEEAKGKTVSMVGVFELNAKHAIEKIKLAEELGIDLVQLAPPHYEKPTDLEVFTYYKMVSEAVSKIGIVVYHTYWAVPEYYEITEPLVAQLADLENIVGIKWASINTANFLSVLFNYAERFAFIDNQGWMQTVKQAFGMDACMFFGGNFDPELSANLGKLFIQGEYERFVEGVKSAMGFRTLLNKAISEEVHGRGSKVKKTIGEGTLAKATMDIFGRPMGPAFPPQYNLSEAAKRRVKSDIGL